MKKIILLLFLLNLLVHDTLKSQITTTYEELDNSNSIVSSIKRFGNDSIWLLSKTTDYFSTDKKNIVERKEIFKKKKYLLSGETQYLANTRIYNFFKFSKKIQKPKTKFYFDYKEKIKINNYSEIEYKIGKIYLKDDILYYDVSEENKNIISTNLFFLIILMLFFSYIFAKKNKERFYEKKLSVIITILLVVITGINIFIIPQVGFYRSVPSLVIILFLCIRMLPLINNIKKKISLTADLIFLSVFILVFSLTPWLQIEKLVWVCLFILFVYCFFIFFIFNNNEKKLRIV